MKKCLILDYGVGNIASVRTFLRENNYIVTFGQNLDDIRETDLLLLPGVGSFETAARNLNNSAIIEEVQSRHSAEKPILAICLGFQLLSMKSSESSTSEGLGIFHGSTERLEEFSRIGWGNLEYEDVRDNLPTDYFFFNHSYGIYDIANATVFARSGNSRYCAVVIQGKTVGVQFHPERSQKSGRKFLAWLEDEIWNPRD
jgi:glutamine amidotransferase